MGRARMARRSLANKLINMLIGEVAAAHFLIMHVNDGCMLDKHKPVVVPLSLPSFIYPRDEYEEWGDLGRGGGSGGGSGGGN